MADLALKKGVRLEDTNNRSAAWASKKIDELKAMPDVKFSKVTDKISKDLKLSINKITEELGQWTFQRRQ